MIRIEVHKEEFREFCIQCKVTELSLFGSVLREDFGPESDVDALVKFSPDARWSLFDLATMEEELRGILGHEVDLVERCAVEGSQNYIRRRHILSSAEPVYVA